MANYTHPTIHHSDRKIMSCKKEEGKMRKQILLLILILMVMRKIAANYKG